MEGQRRKFQFNGCYFEFGRLLKKNLEVASLTWEPNSKGQVRFCKTEKGKKGIPGVRNSTGMKEHTVEKEPLSQLEHSMFRSEGGRRMEKDKTGTISDIRIMINPACCSKVLILPRRK